MSESRHPALGRFPTDWHVARLGDVATKIQDGTHFSPRSASGPYRYLTSKNVRFGRMDITDCAWISEQEHRAIYSRCDVQFGDVLLTKDGANTGNAALNSLNEPFSLLSSVAIIRTDDISVHSPFVLQYLLSPHGQQRLKDLMAGNAITRLTLEKIKDFTIPVPPVRDQRKIARILATLDNLIEQTEALMAKYQAVKQGMMHDLFTRGVDEYGHLRPTQPESPALYEQSKLGWIPKDWWVATIGELFDKRTEHGKEGLPVMSVVMRDGLVERSSVDRRVESNLPPQGHALVLKGDIAYNMMRMWQGVLGRASFDCLVSPAYVVLKPKDTIDTHFAALLFSDRRSIQRFRQFSQGVVDDRLRLYFHDLVDIAFAVPTSVDEQREIAWRVEACNKRIVTETTALEQYQQLRLGLMQDLLTGKVRVKVDESEEVAVNG